MTPDLKELERLARAATPGPWAINTAGIAKRGEPFKITEIYVYAPETQDDTAICADVIDPVTQEPSEANAAYIAAANPAAILSLIAELTRPETTLVSIMRAELEQAKKDAERYRWLTADHADAEMRDLAEDTGIRLRWMSKGSADAAIDAAMESK